ncbi:SMC-Scp complex subunit ScpB [Verrucosispora sp. WMMD573]|uniref:SMC-Scp complex subunit ScpB n=1 Tax=Verrucosispora sp. WMMD573 TaxID=3015149 RepID=UPI00248B3402|nr:SMC-Scp complex subunit ScpB [Verrucosispora sp. WMMD573]WBB52357.1 SMC-Scp complex subunit ScpB [Verrucosispora sp. WMMD573]
MSNEERPDSLAEQAAAWIPPWQRPAPAPPEDSAPSTDPAPSTPPASPTDPAPSTPPASPADPAAAPTTAASVAVGEAADLGAQVPLQGPLPSKIELVEGRAGGGGGGDGRTGEGVPELGRKRSVTRVRPVLEPAAELDDAELRGALEAILLVVDEPVSELVLAQVLEQPAERIGPMLDEIAASFTAAGHGFELRRAAGGWRLYTRPEYATYVERFILDGQSVRLTQAALETLAVVAYKQPVTRSRISAIRGVNCDGVIRTLVSRGLVEECGTESDSGAYLYRTSTLFLEKLGLNSLDDLPPLAPFLPDDVEELADAAR